MNMGSASPCSPGTRAVPALLFSVLLALSQWDEHRFQEELWGHTRRVPQFTGQVHLPFWTWQRGGHLPCAAPGLRHTGDAAVTPEDKVLGGETGPRHIWAGSHAQRTGEDSAQPEGTPGREACC